MIRQKNEKMKNSQYIILLYSRIKKTAHATNKTNDKHS
jgi:hypothetical protein